MQGRVLLQRSWRQVSRDKATTMARIMSNVSSAIIFGSIYWRMGRKQVGIQNRMGLLQARLCHIALSNGIGISAQEQKARVAGGA